MAWTFPPHNRAQSLPLHLPPPPRAP
eukprot:SAG22_NODE_8490_length_651_cov_2.331522_1_plen_25_part_01